MDDLIERLRSVSASYEPARAILLLRNAADLLEQQADQVEDARRTAEYWKAEHNAANVRITALQSERDALVNSVAAGGKEAVAWQVRRADGRIDSVPVQWENCTQELYNATLATGRYAGYENGPRCEVRALYTAPTAALENGDELSLQALYEDACIVANTNARDAKRYRWLRRRAVMVDYSDETITRLTLFKEEGPTGEFLDDWIDGEAAPTKKSPAQGEAKTAGTAARKIAS